MRKTLLLLMLAACTGAAQSQVKFGVQGGFTFSRTQMDNYFSDLRLDYLIGPSVGLMAGINLGESNFSLMQEINYTFKGASIEGTDNSTGTPVKVEGKHSTRYLELPLNLLYYLDAGNGHFFFGAGPYAAMGLSGKNKFTYAMSAAPEVENSTVEFGGEPDMLKQWDFGVQGLVGYKLGYGSYVKAYYSQGLSNLSNLDGFNYTNRYFGLSFGYFFGSGK
jgi:hypothetical protein